MIKLNYLLLILLFPLLWACKKGGQEPPPTSGREIVVDFGMSGDILSVDEEPLPNSKNTPSNDIYAIQVRSKALNSSGGYKPYAYGMFDHRSGLKISLLEGALYEFEATMVVEGKNKISTDTRNNYRQPFNMTGSNATSTVDNRFYKSTGTYFSRLYNGDSYLSLSDGGSVMLKRPDTDRFYGIVSEYNPTSGIPINLSMSRVVFGVKCVVEDLTHGILIVRIDGAPEISLRYDAPEREVQKIITLSGGGLSDNSWYRKGYSEMVNVSIVWDQGDGSEILVKNQTIQFKRKFLHTLRIKLSALSSDADFDISLEDDKLEDGGEITIGDKVII